MLIGNVFLLLFLQVKKGYIFTDTRKNTGKKKLVSENNKIHLKLENIKCEMFIINDDIYMKKI